MRQPQPYPSASPRVVVNPYAAAAGGASPQPPPQSPAAAAYSIEAMAAELQRSQAALARLRAENRKYREQEEMAAAPLSGGILAWSEAKAVRTMQSANMCNGALLVAAAVGSFFIPGDTTASTFARIVLVAYMMCAGAGRSGRQRALPFLNFLPFFFSTSAFLAAASWAS